MFDEIKYISNKTRNDFAYIKSSYEYTIQNIEKVFNQQDIYYGFYETLFSEASFEKSKNSWGFP